MRTPTHEEKLSDISRVVHLLSKQCISLVDYRDAGGKYSRWHMFLGGDTWTGLCGELGISTKTAGRVTDDEYFERLAKFVRREKRLPKVSERAVARLQFRKRRWPTLSKFIEEAIRRGKISDSYSPTPSEPPLPPSSTSAHRPIDRASSSSSVRQVPPPPRFDLRKHPKWRRIDIAGMPYEPQDENAVIALFAILSTMCDFNLEL